MLIGSSGDCFEEQKSDVGLAKKKKKNLFQCHTLAPEIPTVVSQGLKINPKLYLLHSLSLTGPQGLTKIIYGNATGT